MITWTVLPGTLTSSSHLTMQIQAKLSSTYSQKRAKLRSFTICLRILVFKKTLSELCLNKTSLVSLINKLKKKTFWILFQMPTLQVLVLHNFKVMKPLKKPFKRWARFNLRSLFNEIYVIKFNFKEICKLLELVLIK